MNLLGINLGKKPAAADGKAHQSADAKKKPELDLKGQLAAKTRLVVRYQATIIALIVAGLLGLTALRMLHYTDPPVDESRVEQNLGKFKQVRIDSKTVQKINQLQNGGAAPGPQIENGRTNPFSE
jgi:hypothetical protein